MSFLCDKTLEQLINNNTIGNNNVNIDQKFQLGPCSVDLKLSRYIAINKYKHFAFIRWLFAPFDVKSTQESIPYLKEHVINVNKGYVMKPGELIYAHSIESVSMPNDKFGIVIGRSSYSRLGLEVNLTNILHQPGHNGVILFQIKNNSSFRVRIYAEMRIAQILIGHLDNPCSKGQDDTDNAKYKAELEPSLIKWKKDKDLKDKEVSKYSLNRVLGFALILSLIITVLLCFFKNDNFLLPVSGIVNLTIIFIRLLLLLPKKYAERWTH